MVRNDGTILWVRIDIITAQGINGAKNIRAVIIDINERQKSQDALVCAKEVMGTDIRQCPGFDSNN